MRWVRFPNAHHRGVGRPRNLLNFLLAAGKTAPTGRVIPDHMAGMVDAGAFTPRDERFNSAPRQQEKVERIG